MYSSPASMRSRMPFWLSSMCTKVHSLGTDVHTLPWFFQRVRVTRLTSYRTASPPAAAAAPTPGRCPAPRPDRPARWLAVPGRWAGPTSSQQVRYRSVLGELDLDGAAGGGCRQVWRLAEQPQPDQVPVGGQEVPVEPAVGADLVHVQELPADPLAG